MDSHSSSSLNTGRNLITYLSVVVAVSAFVFSATDLDFFVNSYRNIDVFGIGFTIPLSLGVAVSSWTLVIAQYALILDILIRQRSTSNHYIALSVVGVSLLALIVQFFVLALFLRGQFDHELLAVRVAVVATAAGPSLAVFRTQKTLWRPALLISVSLLSIAATVYAFGVARTPRELGRYSLERSPLIAENNNYLTTLSHRLFYGKRTGIGRESYFSGTLDITRFSDTTLNDALRLINRDLTGRNLVGLNAHGRSLRDLRVLNSDLSGANLSFANLGDTNFSKSNLSLANLSFAKAVGTDFVGANLTGASFSSANLTLADFMSANLRLTTFNASELKLANLRSADASGAVFIESRLDGALFSGATLIGALFREVSFENLMLAKAKVWRAWPSEDSQVIFGLKPPPWPETAIRDNLDLGTTDFSINANFRRLVDKLLSEAERLESIRYEMAEGPFRSLDWYLGGKRDDLSVRTLESPGITIDTDKSLWKETERKKFLALSRLWTSGKHNEAAYYGGLLRLVTELACGREKVSSQGEAYSLLLRITHEELLKGAARFQLFDYGQSSLQVAERVRTYRAYLEWARSVNEAVSRPECLRKLFKEETLKRIDKEIGKLTEEISGLEKRVSDYQRSQRIEQENARRERDETRRIEDAIARCDPVVVRELNIQGCP